MSAPWPFAPYEKIAESLEQALGDDEAAFRALRRAEWIVTEKIHGANFCLASDGAEVRAARRKAFLSPDEDFFGHRAVLDRLVEPVRRLAARLRAAEPTTRIVYVFGEIFGGGYPHPDVAPEPMVQPVQTGCWYSPRIEFQAFDLAVVAAEEARRYVDFDDAARLFDAERIDYARPLFRGAYEDAISYPIGFVTHLPARRGLPPLPNNKAEGVVIKPARAVVVPRREGVLRPVIKRKIAEFAEDARFHGAAKWEEPPAAGAPALAILRYEAAARVTETRLQAAVSKVGRVGPGDTARAGEVMRLVIEDLHAELAAHAGEALRALKPTEKAELARFIAGEARALVELYLGVAPP